MVVVVGGKQRRMTNVELTQVEIGWSVCVKVPEGVSPSPVKKQRPCLFPSSLSRLVRCLSRKAS